MSLPQNNTTPSDVVDSANKYLKAACLLCSLFTVISGLVLYCITNKVKTCISPLQAKIITAEEKLKAHILFSEEIFDVTVGTIKGQIVEIRKSQTKICEKQDHLRDKLDEVQLNFNNKIDDVMLILLQIKSGDETLKKGKGKI